MDLAFDHRVVVAFGWRRNQLLQLLLWNARRPLLLGLRNILLEVLALHLRELLRHVFGCLAQSIFEEGIAADIEAVHNRVDVAALNSQHYRGVSAIRPAVLIECFNL